MKTGFPYIPESGVVLETFKNVRIQDNFLQCLKLFGSPVKPWKLVVFLSDWLVVTMAISPLMLIAHMV